MVKFTIEGKCEDLPLDFEIDTNNFVHCPILYRQYKKSHLWYCIKFKQQTDFAIQAETVLFLTEYVDDCRNRYNHQ